jgi:hypothetical protein
VSENIGLESLARRRDFIAYDAAYLQIGASHEPSPGHFRRPTLRRGACGGRCARPRFDNVISRLAEGASPMGVNCAIGQYIGWAHRAWEGRW